MKKFTTLTHNGPVFPPEYKPKGYKVNDITLSPLSEEMLVAYAKLKDTDYLKDSVFVQNFYRSLKPELPKSLQSLKFPEDFKSILEQMYQDNEVLKEMKKARSKEEKAAEKEEKAQLKEKYGYALLNGKKEPLASYVIEPPCIYMGRGESPIRGLWKYRVKPEDVSINFVSNGHVKAPEPPREHHWKEVKQNTNAFVAVWFDIDIGHKFIFTKKFRFGPSSNVNKNQDQIKFEKARKLVHNWSKIEKHIEEGLESDDEITKQSALISWLILQTGIRIGNEHIEGCDNNCVGASTLRQKNIELIVEEQNK